jgi:hypothetical protein
MASKTPSNAGSAAFPRINSPRLTMTDDPLALTLKDAAERYGFSVGTLRAEIAKGRLTKYRIGKKDWTTPADIREMIESCRVEQKAPASIVTRRAASTRYETERASFDSAQQALLKLRNSSRNTLRPNTGQRQARVR